MKVFFIVIYFFCFSLPGKAQYSKDSIELVSRLDVFMENNRVMDFDKVLDYTYPKLFSIAPREQVQEAMESALMSEDMAIKLDSLKVVKVYPVFGDNNNRYAKITYSMVMNMRPVHNDSSEIRTFLQLMQASFGEQNVTIDRTGTGINVFQEIDMAAIKDEISPVWTFINLKKDDPLMDVLFEKDIIALFYTY